MGSMVLIKTIQHRDERRDALIISCYVWRIREKFFHFPYSFILCHWLSILFHLFVYGKTWWNLLDCAIYMYEHTYIQVLVTFRRSWTCNCGIHKGVFLIMLLLVLWVMMMMRDGGSIEIDMSCFGIILGVMMIEMVVRSCNVNVRVVMDLIFVIIIIVVATTHRNVICDNRNMRILCRRGVIGNSI